MYHIQITFYLGVSNLTQNTLYHYYKDKSINAV
jgi:hypothetical protein